MENQIFCRSGGGAALEPVLVVTRQNEVGKDNAFEVCCPALVHRRIYTILAALVSDKCI